eukprot:19315-Eustigmatos_ZCMA.PRE.1
MEHHDTTTHGAPPLQVRQPSSVCSPNVCVVSRSCEVMVEDSERGRFGSGGSGHSNRSNGG